MFRNPYIFLVSLILIYASCSRSDSAPANPQISLLQSISGDTSLSILHAAMLRSKADTFFREGGPFTVFAPVNKAFLDAGLSRQQIESYDPVALNDILSYHIIPGRHNSTTLVGFTNAFPYSMNPYFNPNILKNYFGIFFNGLHIEEGSKDLSDGTVHRIGSVSMPPADSIMKVLAKQQELTYFTAALTRCKTLLNFVLNDSITLLPPTDAAFREFGILDIDQINNMDTFALTKLINPFVLEVNQRLYAPQFIGGRMMRQNSMSFPNLPAPRHQVVNVLYRTSADGKQIVPNKPDQATGILVPPNFLRTNILSKRGIIHTIDRLFVP